MLKKTVNVAFFQIIILTLFANGASAQTDLARWNKYFEGTPANIGIDWQMTGGQWALSGKPFVFKNWIKGYSQCSAVVDDLLNSLAEYDVAFNKGDLTQSETDFKKINGMLAKDGSCKPVLQRAYWAGIVSLGPAKKDAVSLRNDTVLFTVFLVNLDLIEPLTPELRNELAAGDSTSLWIKKADGDYYLLGAYDCKLTKILLSTTLRPFNASATLMHEINHLYTDKKGFAGSQSWKSKDMKMFVYSDELASSFMGSSFQRRLYLSSKNTYTPQNDEFNLFKTDGILSHLMMDIPVQSPFNSSVYFELYFAFFSDVNSVREPLCQMQKMIMGAYYPSYTGDCDSKYLIPEMGSDESASLDAFLFNSVILRIDSSKTSQYMKNLEDFDAAIKTESLACQTTEKAGDDGKLDDYIGKSLKIHPGNSGVKPGFSVHPCIKVQF